MKVSGFTWAIQWIYMIVLSSLMFWLNFLRGFILLGTITIITPAKITGHCTTDDP